MNAYHESLKDVPTVLTEFCKHELGPTGRERMRVGRLGDGDVLYRPSEGHLVRLPPSETPFLAVGKRRHRFQTQRNGRREMPSQKRMNG